MTDNFISTAQMPTGLGLAGPVNGSGSRTAYGQQAAGAADGFTQLFLQLRQVFDGDSAASAIPATWMGEDGEKPQRDKAGIWAALMAMLDMVPGQMDFKQYMLVDPEGGQGLDLGSATEIRGPDGWQALLANLTAWYKPEGALDETLSAQALAARLAQSRGGPWDMQDLADWAEMLGLQADSGDGFPLLYADTVAETQSAWSAQNMPGEAGLAETAGQGAQALADGMTGQQIQVIGYRSSQEAQADSDEAAQGRALYDQAIREAKPKQAGKDAMGDDKSLFAMAEASMAGRSTGPWIASKVQAMEEPGVPEQILAGLSKNLQAGRGEFVLKLVPEGLGEITVRLLAKEGKTTLRIITASAETARLINQDIQALQNALKPIQVEVREAVQEAGAGQENSGYFPGFDQFDQFNQFNQYKNQSEPGGKSSRGIRGIRAEAPGEGVDESPVEGAARAARTIAPEAAMDIYI